MGPDRGERTPNHLDGETSPYLLQHVLNPVDWYPWGAQAHDRARKEDKPIFLSIGYAACHWCHVMERESFENAEIAALLNRHFVSIKVDREERPDIDEIYMNAVQLMTGAGGWPLSAFLTPDLEPFFTGTYFPPEDRYGRPGFGSLLRGIHLAWTGRRQELTASAGEITEKVQAIASSAETGNDGAPIDVGLQMLAVAEWTRRFDSSWGGFGSAPKFPADGAIAVLLREHHRSGEPLPFQLATRTLDAMAAGGLYDHVGGGFSRYSVDERWLVPHFEKMLYNQALLVPLYVEAYKTAPAARYRRIVEETLEFVRRELTDPTDGFHSSLDADSEGEEGKFYLWTPQEIKSTLGNDEAEFYCKLYDIDATGNFEGRSIPNLLRGTVEEQSKELGLPIGQSLDRIRADHRRLLTARAERVRPGTDDKILAAWNGLMITAFARAYQTFGHPPDLESAKKSVEFVRSRMMEGDRLRVSYRQGRAKLNAYLDDYAFFARGALDLYEACFDPTYLLLAERVARSLIANFEDRENGGFWFVSHDHEGLIARSRTAHDGALPSGTGVATELLIRLGAHLADRPFREAAERALVAYRPAVERSPAGFASMLIAADWARGPLTEVAVVGSLTESGTRELLTAVHTRFIPRLVLAAGSSIFDGRSLPMLAGKMQIDEGPTAFVCRDYACRAPVNSIEALTEQLDRC